MFYVIYYACLAGFFMAMLVVFYQTLDDEVPKWLNSNGIIGDNPGKRYAKRPILSMKPDAVFKISDYKVKRDIAIFC